MRRKATAKELGKATAKELQELLADHTWRKVPSVCREGAWFYYRRDENYIAHRIMLDAATGHWFLHVSAS